MKCCWDSVLAKYKCANICCALRWIIVYLLIICSLMFNAITCDSILLLIQHITETDLISNLQSIVFCNDIIMIWCFCIYSNVVRLQINIDDHDPEYCKDYYEEWGTPARPECPIPQFSGDGASVSHLYYYYYYM